MAKRPKGESIHQPNLFELENPSQPASQLNADRPFSLPDIFLGTSSFTASGWEGSFYPSGMRLKDFLRHYASQFQTVEIDSTFYGTPSPSTVTAWNQPMRRSGFHKLDRTDQELLRNYFYNRVDQLKAKAPEILRKFSAAF